MQMSKIQLFSLLLGIFQPFVISGDICQTPVCEYHFQIGHHRTMLYRKGLFRTFNAILNGTNVFLEPNQHGRPPLTTDDVSDDVITADGIRRNIIAVNGMYPGPSIEIMEGTQVVVHVTNHLLTQSVSLHWHGIHQRKTTWMDGTAYISQCPILSGQSFTYRFIASPAGTHWYHDHIEDQRSDGLMGMLIVHKALPTLPEITLVLSDWFHYDSTTADLTDIFNWQGGAGDNMDPSSARDYSHDVVGLSSLRYQSGLINGRGRFGGNMMPLSTTVLPAGQNTHFRVVNSGAEFQFEFSIDQHQLHIVALDGQDIIPITADSFMIAPGERIDFLLTTNQNPENYWLRCKTLKEGVSPELIKDGIEQVVYAIIRYEGAPDRDPTSVPATCSQSENCQVFNCPWEGYPAAYNKTCIPPDEVKSAMSQSELDEEYGLKDDDYEEYILNFGSSSGNAINNIGFIHPRSLMSDPNYKKATASCETKLCQQTNTTCRCTQTIEIPYNKTIQMVFSSYQPVPEGQFALHAHHGIHMHGHNFAVLRMGFPTYNTTTGRVIEENSDVICDTPICRRPRWNGFLPKLNFDKPQIRDTVVIPARGYVVLRFRSTNPGHWLLHCHVTTHASGMALIISEAEERILAPPENFPTCNIFDWSEAQFSRYMDQPSNHSLMDNYIPSAQPNQTETLGQTKQPLVPQETTTAQQQTPMMSDEWISFPKKDFIGLIIGCVAFGAVLMFVPFMCILCMKSKHTII